MKPNFIFLFADQLQAFALGCMDNAAIRTPNLDALAADGVLFRNAYSDSPVCTPYRGCLMTGLYPSQSGIRSNADGLPNGQRCLPHSLNDAGYQTSYIGKWHLGDSGNRAVEPEQRGGFTHFIGYQCYNSFRDEVLFFDEAGNERRFEKHRTAATTDLAIERIDAIKNEPFACFVSYQNPHYPIEPDPAFEALYAAADLPVRSNVHSDTRPFTPTVSPFSPRPVETDPNYQRYGRSLCEFRRLYYALVTQLDCEVGRLIRYLKRAGLYNNSVIIFTSDHGEMMGSHGFMNKGRPHEESARVPLIARAPEGARGQIIETPVSAGVDIWPTLIDFAGYSESTRLAGHSWKQALCEGELAVRPPIIAEHPWPRGSGTPHEGKTWLMIRDGDWKMVVDQESLSIHSIHNLAEDPCEMVNIRDETPEAVSRRMLEHLRHWKTLAES